MALETVAYWGYLKFSRNENRIESIGLGLAALLAAAFINRRTIREGAVFSGKSGAPPLDAEFLFFLFYDPQRCDALVGDLEERYKLIHTKFGKRRADFWYWTQALQSVGPIVWAWTKRAALKPVLSILAWAVGKNLIAQDSLWGLVVDLWRRIRL